MSHPRGARVRLSVELVEADIEIGFNLVDMAQTETACGNSFVAARVLRDVEDVVKDIEQRLPRLSEKDRESFGPLVEELRREIDNAKARAELRREH